MKIKNIGILYLIAAIVLALLLVEAGIIGTDWNAILIHPLGIEISFLWLDISGIVAGIYLLILTKQYLDAKMSGTKELYSGMIILVVSLILLFLVQGFISGPLGIISVLALILPAVVIIIDYWFSGLQWVREICEQRIKQYTAREEKIAAKIEQLNERARRIENKAEKVEWIVKKVSD